MAQELKTYTFLQDESTDLVFTLLYTETTISTSHDLPTFTSSVSGFPTFTATPSLPS